ncbi:MAG: protein adenylyltransferase SelO family protein, partial [Chitinophagaceae bacterium]|nr:protein adenylyltransferase SelO family protein [Chitinophagaceae bacterium]
MTFSKEITQNEMIGWKWNQSYASLPELLFSHEKPTPVADPKAVLINYPLAKSLGLEINDTNITEIIRQLSGCEVPEGTAPIAQAYMGHQFGYLNMLGDGRAILLGEHITPDGKSFDIHLKGSGPTKYSRRGDGRATLSACLREYMISEAMFHLGIPTSRSLAVMATGEPVYRETVQDGGVLTRVMSSHIRVGTFEYATRHLEKV